MDGSCPRPHPEQWCREDSRHQFFSLGIPRFHDYTCSSASDILNTKWYFSAVSLDDCRKDE